MPSIPSFRFNNEEPLDGNVRKATPEDHRQAPKPNDGKDRILVSAKGEGYVLDGKSLDLNALKQGSVPKSSLKIAGLEAPATIQDLDDKAHPALGEGLLATEDVLTQVLSLSSEQLESIATKKATCPFIGSAVSGGALPVRNTEEQPLADISDVVALGNSGGGNLGNLLELFAKGNHSKMLSKSGALDSPLPPSLFSLDFPGSQGSHPGHSGILQGDPSRLNTGRFSPSEFDRLAMRAKDGYLKRSDIAHFIAENLLRDPDSKVFSGKAAGLLLADLGNFVAKTGPAILQKIAHRQDDAADREVLEALTKTLGENNLIGSTGEFGLLMAFLANSPNTKEIDGEPAVSLADVTLMFRDHQFPEGWENWPKTEKDWVLNTTALLIEAGKEYLHHQEPAKK
ncbi:hypothetical protein COW36_11175 [bacterium (Candidatus Blackallbacteria) CG17_big_fil_post_rev_8_21_14_2_50_48_46]|uniref:Uncharacterized protein n=1 Tax=bacterium (Candidatus Blackallbacteria) CG17_big_fil_post_rev_8_21_14_2_50_48_46 TaxID=2014261 RepID=A0A2M7G4J3_9BACT|nr:MAG: hypothetical protein COW64_18270 [bacterium (Candidatus Blackallbacteria) CG18_big_fil_WC_8_21_14_2_50_49_26]PIW16836.1 MAG: hypothetical protein COW36_11175 [bacterium (Candidatus Blackallbacteria) CG17_big_fil_post_rev_8_21_14_2_50_48_46]PIW48033.1 MAG: hypothetical protein COW20_10890 [bacterium (Candidatus Blackallbacteria) CG13_big_fil_rev_8_21_14_2_50_49_14]